MKKYCTPGAFDLLVITNEGLVKGIKSLPALQKCGFNYDFMLVPETDDLYKALQYKAHIFDYPLINRYHKVLFLDVDIIVQNDIAKLFAAFKPKPDILYGLHEQNGTHHHKFWSLMKYTLEDIKNFMERNIITFNVGTMMFTVSPQMRLHFENLKRMMKTSKVPHFYEQSFFNHYFNKKYAIDTDFFQNKVVIFPIPDTYYAHPYFVHFSGIGQYERKAVEMNSYLKLLKQKKHDKLLRLLRA